MEPLGRKVYWETDTGNIILAIGERTNSIETTWDQDFSFYNHLIDRNPATVSVKIFLIGYLADDFAACNSFRIDPATKEPIFSYPDPNVPPAPPVYQKPLTEQVTGLKAQLEDSKSRQADIIFAMVDNNLM